MQTGNRSSNIPYPTNKSSSVLRLWIFHSNSSSHQPSSYPEISQKFPRQSGLKLYLVGDKGIHSPAKWSTRDVFRADISCRCRRCCYTWWGIKSTKFQPFWRSTAKVYTASPNGRHGMFFGHRYVVPMPTLLLPFLVYHVMFD